MLILINMEPSFVQNDKRERVVKASRDLTMNSKKVIFQMHRLVHSFFFLLLFLNSIDFLASKCHSLYPMRNRAGIGIYCIHHF